MNEDTPQFRVTPYSLGLLTRALKDPEWPDKKWFIDGSNGPEAYRKAAVLTRMTGQLHFVDYSKGEWSVVTANPPSSDTVSYIRTYLPIGRIRYPLITAKRVDYQ